METTRFISSNFFSPEIRDFYEIMWKDIVQPDRPLVTIKYGASAVHAG